MRFTLFVAAVGMLLAGCAGPESVRPQTAKQMPPGYGVMLTTFKYVPGQSKFPKDQILYDAKYTAGRLSAIGYQAFIVYSGGNTARVGIRATSHQIAVSLQKQFERAGSIDLKDGRKLKIYKTEVKNLAELQVGTVEDIK